MKVKSPILLAVAAIVLVTGALVALLLPGRECSFNPFVPGGFDCSGTPSWVRVLVLGAALVSALVLASFAVKREP